MRVHHSDLVSRSMADKEKKKVSPFSSPQFIWLVTSLLYDFGLDILMKPGNLRLTKLTKGNTPTVSNAAEQRYI